MISMTAKLRSLGVSTLIGFATTIVPLSAHAQQQRPCPLCELPTVNSQALPAGTGAIVGLVVDTAHGEPAVGAVRLVKEHGDPARDRGVANAGLQRDGGFVLVGIPSGRYDLFVLGSGTRLTLPSILVKAGRVDTLTIRVINRAWPNSPDAN